MIVEIKEGIISTKHIAAVITGKTNYVYFAGQKMSVSKESAEKLISEMAVKPKKEQSSNKELEALFLELFRLTGGKGEPVFNESRKKKLKDLLTKHKMNKELLVKAATNIGNDDFLQGKNDRNKRYGNIDYLLRPDKAAHWAEEQTQPQQRLFVA